AIGTAWMAVDGAGCYHFCYHISRLWPVSGNGQTRDISLRVLGMTQVGSFGSLRKKQTGRRRKGSRMNTKRGPGQSDGGKSGADWLRCLGYIGDLVVMRA